MTLEQVMDHLWQSTLVVGAIALLTLGLRRTLAQTRYWIWFAASLKFLIPFAALASIGAQFHWREALPPTPAEWTFAIEAASQPFTVSLADIALPRAMSADGGLRVVTVIATIWGLGCATVLSVWLFRWRRVSAAVRAGAPITSGRIHDTFTRLGASSMLPLVASDTSLEPGVFGIVRPVLLWPRDIDTRLDDAQVHAILAHELAHVRRRDNLTATAHMLVEAVFWFHPLVWWIGSRLVDERERACDEEVLRLGSEPHVYAESILKTCQFYVESPLSCVPGVTGSDLKKRIERIMAHRHGTTLGTWGKSLLVSTAVMTLAAPVAIGALTVAPRPDALELAAAGTAPSFTTATVKANTTGSPRVMMRVAPGGIWDASNVTLESMVRLAYRLQEFQVAGGPAWIYTDRFDIQAQSEQGSAPGEFGRRMQSLLGERFNLKVHTETRELPIYALVFAASDGRRGPSLTPAAVDCVAFARDRAATAARGAPLTPVRQPGERPTCGTMTGRGRLSGGGTTMEQLAATLSQYTGRIVLDRTGVSGSFDYELRFAHDPGLRGRGPGGGLPVPPEPADPANAGVVSIFTALQEQLGLKLDAQRAPVDVLVIDSADRPVEN
jgi:bla regulator protein blaR1